MTMTNSNEQDGAPVTPKHASGYGSLTAREGEILAKAMTCLKSAPEIDFHKLAAELNMGNHRSAVNAWGNIRKKMSWNPTAASDTPGSAKSIGGSSKRKNAATTDKDDDGGDDEEPSPTKKPRTPAKPRRKAAVTPKKTIKPSRTPAAASKSSEDDEKVPVEVHPEPHPPLSVDAGQEANAAGEI